MKKLSALLALIFVLTCGVSVFAQDNHNRRDDDNSMHQRRGRHRHHRRHHRRNHDRDHDRGNDNHH